MKLFLVYGKLLSSHASSVNAMRLIANTIKKNLRNENETSDNQMHVSKARRFKFFCFSRTTIPHFHAT